MGYKRDIKFRAWNRLGGTMVKCDNWTMRQLMSDDKDFIIMQFTGLKDLNGKEIYGGDVIMIGPHRGVVTYEGQACSFWIKWKEGQVHRYKELTANEGTEEGFYSTTLEVIGNIHEK